MRGTKRMRGRVRGGARAQVTSRRPPPHHRGFGKVKPRVWMPPRGRGTRRPPPSVVAHRTMLPFMKGVERDGGERTSSGSPVKLEDDFMSMHPELGETLARAIAHRLRLAGIEHSVRQERPHRPECRYGPDCRFGDESHFERFGHANLDADRLARAYGQITRRMQEEAVPGSGNDDLVVPAGEYEGRWLGSVSAGEDEGRQPGADDHGGR